MASGLTLQGAESAGNSPWQDLREWRFSEAARAFARAPNEPASRLGHAVALLNVQPRTVEGLERAERELVALAEVDSVDVELSVAARYLLARIAEVHAIKPDPRRAVELYGALFAAHPQHPLAQSAVAKLATLRLYRLGSEPLSTLAALEALGQQLTDVGARRDFHLVMGRSYLFFGGDQHRALEHLEAALAAGVATPTMRADLLVQIGALARDLNQSTTARRVWNEFLKTSLRDPREDLVRRHLEALPVEGQP